MVGRVGVARAAAEVAPANGGNDSSSEDVRKLCSTSGATEVRSPYEGSAAIFSVWRP